MADELTQWLTKLNLQQYDASIREAGAENLGDLRDLSQQEIKDDLFPELPQMKPLHKKKFLKAHKLMTEGSSEVESKDFDAFLEQCNCIKFKEQLMENGVLSLKDLDSMSQDDIKMILGDSGLKALHKKKFLKLYGEYKDGNFVPTPKAVAKAEEQKQAPPVQQQPQVQQQPPAQQQQPQQQNQMDPFGAMMGGMMGGMMNNMFGGGLMQQHQQRKQNMMGGMGGMGGMFGGMMGGMNKMMQDPNFQKMHQQDMEVKKMELQNEKLRLEKEKLAEQNKPEQATIIHHSPQAVVSMPAQTDIVIQQGAVLPNCRGNHGLTFFTSPRGGFRCNSCNRTQRIRSQMYGCRACNYDLCVACYQQLTVAPSISTQQIQVMPMPVIQPTTTIQEVNANEACPKCHGNGFTHDSTMNHDKPQNTKCFFCKDCSGCKGKGFVKSKQKIITNTDAYGRATVSQVSSMSTCIKCKGHGWSHDSSMKHDKPPNQKCFFCKACKICKGSGRLET